jgi:hypothetical protein
MDRGGGVKLPGLGDDRSPLPNAEVKNLWSYRSPSTSSYVFMTWCLIMWKLKLSLRSSHKALHHKGVREVDVYIQIFLNSALVETECSATRPGRFTPGERAPSTHWMGGWLGLRTGLDDVEKRKFLTLLGLELQHLGRPARSQSLHRLRYWKQLLVILLLLFYSF